MSPALPQLSGKEVLLALESVGFVHVSTRGSHAKLRHEDGRTVIVPMHRSLARGTLGSILRQAGLTSSQFGELLD
jgi:predicted RNA binding protein YcfA (HicA-like mRNA interferase family)